MGRPARPAIDARGGWVTLRGSWSESERVGAQGTKLELHVPKDKKYPWVSTG